jgi:hypothetical protein
VAHALTAIWTLRLEPSFRLSQEFQRGYMIAQYLTSDGFGTRLETRRTGCTGLPSTRLWWKWLAVPL